MDGRVVAVLVLVGLGYVGVHGYDARGKFLIPDIDFLFALILTQPHSNPYTNTCARASAGASASGDGDARELYTDIGQVKVHIQCRTNRKI